MGAACPGDAELGRFAAGDLPASDRLRILEHADGCSVCYGLLAGVLASTLQGGEGQPRPAAPLGQGDTIGRYTVLHRLGAGGMGVVYAAYDAKLDRKVAIKLLHPRGGNDDAQDRARLEREARALARLTDPHVVAVH
ncbi:MAG: protein kinase, partial [Myxococcota bacterium]